HLAFDPPVGFLQACAKWLARRPPKFLLDQPVVRVASPHPQRTGDMLELDLLAGDVRDGEGRLVDAHHFVGADIEWPSLLGAGQPHGPLNAFVDIEEGARLFAIAPDLDRIAVLGARNFPADRRRRLFAPTVPGSFGSEYVVVARNPAFHATASRIGEVKPFRE